MGLAVLEAAARNGDQAAAWAAEGALGLLRPRASGSRCRRNAAGDRHGEHGDGEHGEPLRIIRPQEDG